MKLGLIGAGNMALAIIKGIVTSGRVAPGDIWIQDLDGEKQKEAVDRYGLNGAPDGLAVAQKCDFVILAVKPNVIQTVARGLRPAADEDRPVFISIAAGKTIAFLEEAFGVKPGIPVPIVRVMPNVNATVGESMSALCRNDAVSADDFETVRGLFDAIGKTVVLSESHFAAFGAIAGSSPAFVFIFIDSLARAGVKAGIPKDEALAVAAQAVLGSAKTVLCADAHPWQLADMVCSPAGTTIEGVAALMDDGFEGTVMRAVEKVIEKDQRL